MKLVVYAVVGIVTMLVAVVLVYVVIRLGGAIRGVDIDATGELTLGDYARQVVVAGLITTFGVALGALLPRPGHHRRRHAHLGARRREHRRRAQAGRRRLAAVHRVQHREHGDSCPAAPATRRAERDALARPQAFLVSLVYIAIVSVAAVFISLRRDVT